MTGAVQSGMIANTMLPTEQGDPITASLDFVREHLGMEVAYLSEFIDDALVFRAVSAPGLEELVQVGGSMPLDQVYCKHILSGDLPQLIPDTANEPLCQKIPLTHAVPIKSHVSVPVMRSDGTPYGMFCCLSRKSHASLNQRDLSVTQAFARISADHINDTLTKRMTLTETAARIQGIIDDEAYDIVYQPIKAVTCQTVKGYEALCRFRAKPYRAPDHWFTDALKVGMQIELEVAVIQKALRALHQVAPEIYVSVNASPDTVSTGQLAKEFARWPCARIVLEITEHSAASDDDLFVAEVEKLREMGVSIAIDDAGAGYSGLQHIIRMKPNMIKLDISLTTSIDTDIVRKSLGAALVRFGTEIDAMIVAEGVETQSELEALKDLQVPYAQGYFLARPAPLEDILAEPTAVA